METDLLTSHNLLINEHPMFLYMLILLFFLSYLFIKIKAAFKISIVIRNQQIYFAENEIELCGKNVFELDYANKLTVKHYDMTIQGESFLSKYTKDFFFFLSENNREEPDYIHSLFNKFNSTFVKLTYKYDNPNYLEVRCFSRYYNSLTHESLLFYIFSNIKKEYKHLIDPVFIALYKKNINEQQTFSSMSGINYSEEIDHVKNVFVLNEKINIEKAMGSEIEDVKVTIKKRL